MAQGNHKLGKSVKSAGSQKHKTVKAGTRKAKGGSFIERNRSIADASKAINKKNERMIAGKASNAGANFFLKDISTKGKCYIYSEYFEVRFYIFLTAVFFSLFVFFNIKRKTRGDPKKFRAK